MTVTAITDYVGTPRDAVENFHGNQLLFVCWDKHLMFAAPFAFPLPPSTRFGDMVAQNLTTVTQPHPDAAKVDWSKATWTRGGKPWQPDFNKTLAEQGLRHKEFLRVQTPGHEGLAGVGI